MSMRVSIAAALAAGFVAIACGERQSPLPEQPTITTGAMQSLQSSFSTKCSFNAASQLAGSYFTNSDTARLVRGIIQDMKSAGANSLGARNGGFDVVNHIGANLAANPDVATGSSLMNELIKCMFSDPSAWPLSFTAAVPGPEDFTVQLDVHQNGALGVRGGTGDATDPVHARLNNYSAVAPPQATTWATMLSGNPAPARALLYGRPSTAQAGVDSASWYNWRVVPRNTAFAPAILVGVCVDPDNNSYGNKRAMVRRQDEVANSYLPFTDAYFLDPNAAPSDPTYCSGPATVIGSLTWQWGQMAQATLRAGVDLLGPRPLQASAFLNPGGLGGSTGGIKTDYGPDVVDSVFLTFVTQPHDARVCNVAVGSGCVTPQTISPVKVLATWKGRPVGGVEITVLPVDNNGVPGEMRGDSTEVTGEDGTVTYTDLGLTKTGGYRLYTIAELVLSRSPLIVIPHVTSTKFNIRP